MQSRAGFERVAVPRAAHPLCNVFVQLARPSGFGFTSRELAVLLVCATREEAQTVRGLSSYIKISKPAVVRAVNRLIQSSLVERIADPGDRRSVQIVTLPGGFRFLTEICENLSPSVPRKETRSPVGKTPIT